MAKHQVQASQLHLFRVLYSADASVSSVTPPTAQIAAPSGNGVFDAQLDIEATLNNAAMIFFGTGTAGQMATAQITGWRQIGGPSSLWIPIPLLNLNLTLGTQAGVNNSAVDASHLFVSTIAASAIYTSANEIITPTGSRIAEAKIDFHGMRYIQVQLAVDDASAINGAIALF